jgi:hypothetical protein
VAGLITRLRPTRSYTTLWDVTFLAEQDQRCYPRAAVRWLGRIRTGREIQLEEAALAGTALAGLTGRGARERPSYYPSPPAVLGVRAIDASTQLLRERQ